MNFFLNDSVLKVINTIENSGGEAYIVGGCVRDLLLGRSPEDFDITTSLPPERVLALFDKTVATGIKHGTVTVIEKGESFEVTTFRTDGIYSDSRHPESVSFVTDLKEDLSRRDFTVNAIAYNPKSGLTDLFGGVGDINRKILKAVREPQKRFSEDALRIMRLFRFSCQLGFEIEEETLNAALRLSPTLEGISRERIARELFKALCSKNPERLNPLIKTGALAFCKIGRGEIPKALSSLPEERCIRFYKFISDLKSDHSAVCSALKTDNVLLCFCKEVNEITKHPIKNTVDCKIALKNFSEKAVRSSLILNCGSDRLAQEVLNSNEPYRTIDLKIGGDDLKRLGYSGKEIGEKLEEITMYVIRNPKDNTKERLTEIISG